MMDTSEQYIKMCEKAVEIQTIGESHKDEEHEWFYDGCQVCHEDDACYYPKPEVWLPRQDQLQDMLSNDHSYYEAWICQIKRVYDFAFSIKDYANMPLSMEQLWLAFVMKEKYNKTWNGEDWVQ